MRAQSSRLKLFIRITVDVIKSYECTTDKCNKIPRAMGGNMLCLNAETLLTPQLKKLQQVPSHWSWTRASQVLNERYYDISVGKKTTFSMGLTDRRKAAKNLVDSRKK